MLLRVHPAMQQPLHCTFRDRGRDRLFLAPRRRVIDGVRLSRYICFEIEQKTGRFSRGICARRSVIFRMLESYQRFADQIEAPPHLAVPQTPPNPIDDFNEIRTHLAIIRRGDRPAFGRLIDMLNPDRKMEACVDGPSGSRAPKRILTGGRLRSCVRPVDAAHDRWPRWDPRSSPKQSSGFESHWFQRVLRIVGSTDTSSLPALTPWHRRAVQVVTG